MSSNVERKLAAVMFTDIVGFTKLSENMPPKDILKLLSGYQAIMIEAIFQNKGTVDKFFGDVVIANFLSLIS